AAADLHVDAVAAVTAVDRAEVVPRVAAVAPLQRGAGQHHDAAAADVHARAADAALAIGLAPRSARGRAVVERRAAAESRQARAARVPVGAPAVAVIEGL